MFYGYKLFNANDQNSYFGDSGPRELFVSISILLPVISIGIYPDFVFSLSVDKVEALLSNYFYPVRALGYFIHFRDGLRLTKEKTLLLTSKVYYSYPALVKTLPDGR